LSLQLAGAAVWSVALLTSCLGLPTILHRFSYPKNNYWAWILGVAILARLVPHLLVPAGGNYDIESFNILSDLINNGEDIYSNPIAEGRHPYLPLLVYWIGFAGKFAESIHQPFEVIYRLLPIVADVSICLVLFFYMKGKDIQSAFKGAMWYALNPIAVFVSAYQGQFDSLPMLFILLAVFSLGNSVWITGSWMGLAILTKSWPVLALPSILASLDTIKKKAIILFMILLIVLIGVGLYIWLFKSDLLTLLPRALSYNHGLGVWGYTYFFRLVWILKPELEFIFSWIVENGRFITLIGLGIVWFARARFEAPAAGILTVLVSFLALTHAFGIQYLVWVLPFAVINYENRWPDIYTATAFLYMLLAYFSLILTTSITRVMPLPQADWFIIMPAALPVWIVSILWMVDRLRLRRTSTLNP
jgi:hypothetical protein